MRLQFRFPGERLVQGAGGTPVASIGLFAPRIDPLATAAESARVHYRAFRRQYNWGTTFSLLAATALVGVTAVYLSRDEPRPSSAEWALLGVSVPLAMIGGGSTARGRDNLHQAVWLYNRSTGLGASPTAEPPPNCTYDTCALRMRRTLFSRTLVRGSGAAPVAHLGQYPPMIDVFDAAGESGRHQYALFRRKAHLGANLRIAAFALAAASGYVRGRDPENRDASNVLLFSGMALIMGGSLSRASADGHLEQAIWLYNRNLPRTP